MITRRSIFRAFLDSPIALMFGLRRDPENSYVTTAECDRYLTVTGDFPITYKAEELIDGDLVQWSLKSGETEWVETNRRWVEVPITPLCAPETCNECDVRYGNFAFNFSFTLAGSRS